MTSAPALIRETVTAEISNSNLTPQKKKEGLEKVEMMLPKLAAAVRTERGDPAMTEEIITEIVKRYARQRTTQEIRQLGAFYKSPAGAKWLTKLPQIVNESMLINQHVVSTSPRKRLSAIKRSVVI